MTSRQRPIRWWERLFEQIAMSRFGTWLVLNVTTWIDPTTVRLTGGRLHSGRLLGVPVALLTTTGARSGLRRTVALLPIRDGDCIVLIASRGGMDKHPG